MNDRLRIASILLGHLITGDPGKDMRARLPEVRHCIDLADLLIGLCETSSPAGAEERVARDSGAGVNAAKRPDIPLPLAPLMAKQLYERRRAALQSSLSRNPKKLH